MSKNNWFRLKPSGKFYIYEVPNSTSAYKTFIPDPLCGELDIIVDSELTSLLSTANRLLGLLEGMSAFLPNAAAIESILLYKEALLSCQIDGIHAPFYDVIDVSQKDSKNVISIKNYVVATKFGLEKINTKQYKNSLLCEIHEILMSSEKGECIGRFRTKQMLMGHLAWSNTDIYNPTSPDKLSLTLNDLEKFITRKDDIDAIIKTALIHYQFETIHPFMSRNGRVGRILSYLMLSNKKILTRSILCLSHYLNVNKVEYIDRMESLHYKKEYEQWIKFFLKSVIFAADDSLNKIKEWLNIREKNIAKIEKSGKIIKNIKRTYDIIELYPIIDVNTLAEKSEISYNTASAVVKLLCNLDILKQSNNMTRNRDYAYMEFLNCFVGNDNMHPHS